MWLTIYLEQYKHTTQNKIIISLINLKLEESRSFNAFLLDIRQQATKSSASEAREVNIKDKIIGNWASVELRKKLLEKNKHWRKS
nr:unnamed protein product [Callosobruchus chinensis]